MIVLVFGLQHWDVSEGVVGDPEPVGQAIGDDHVNGVQPVQRVQALRRVWG